MKKLMLLSVIVLFSSCMRQVENEQQINSEVLSLFDYYPEIKNIAHDWDSNAELTHVSIDVITPFSSRRTARIDTSFESENKSGEVLSVLCSSLGCESFIFDQNYSSLDYIAPIQLEYIELDSNDVLQIALENGAKPFLLAEGNYCDLRLVYKENKLTWFGHFGMPGSSLDIYIDPITGTIIDKEINAGDS